MSRTGEHAPGTESDVNFNGFPHWEDLSDSGQTAFYAPLSDGSSGIWSGISGDLRLVARTRDPAPGFPNGVTYLGLSGDPVLDGAGQPAFPASIIGASGVPFLNGPNSIWSERSGTLTLVALTGNQAPGKPAGENFDRFARNRQVVAVNDAGRVAFEATTWNGSDRGDGIWSDRFGTLSLVAGSGDPAPGMPGVNFACFSICGVEDTTKLLNDASQIAFVARVSGPGVDPTNNSGIWSERSGNLALVARKGSQAPDLPSGMNFASFGYLELNNSGQIAFYDDQLRGIWSDVSGSLSLVASCVYCGEKFALNDAGQIAFSDGADIWLASRTGEVQRIIGSGDLMEVAPSDFRTISSLFFAGNYEDQHRTGLNNLGQIGFLANFTDGSSGIFVSNAVAVPEPSTIRLAVFGLGTIGAIGRRRRFEKRTACLPREFLVSSSPPHSGARHHDQYCADRQCRQLGRH